MMAWFESLKADFILNFVQANRWKYLWDGLGRTLLITLLAGVIEAFSHLEIVQHAFGGIRVCVCVLILNAVIKLFKKAVIDLPSLLIFLAVTLLSLLTPISPVIFVVLAAVLGITVKAIGGKKA